MDAREFKLTEVLSRNERFIVPLYQRQYQWHDSRDGKRTEHFWKDVEAKAADVLEGRARFEHYMGALLLVPGTTPRSFGMTPSVQVVDGQQRITTFLILLSVIREIAQIRGFDEVVAQCTKHLFNEPGKSDIDEFVKFKLTPTPVDREVFFDILRGSLDDLRRKYKKEGAYWGGSVPMNTKFRALRCYEFLVGQVERFLSQGPEEDIGINQNGSFVENPIEETDTSIASERLSALLEALVFHLKLIVITLDERDDAQVIFETLNSAGQPLLAMDLVRNNIFHRAEEQYRVRGESGPSGESGSQERAEKLYQEVWAPFDDPWWRNFAPFARPQRPRIDHFLANVLTAETGERTTVRELYAEYRAWATPNRRPRFSAVEDELAVIQNHAPTYKTLEGELKDDSTIAWLGERLRLWQYTTVYPVAFQIATAGLDDAEREAMSRSLDSYLTRRSLCDLTAKNLNQLFPRLANAFRNSGVSLNSMREFFARQDSPTTRFPDNTELRSGILERPVYSRIPARILSDILWMLEIQSRGLKTEATARPGRLWIEHVMPIRWQEHWPIADENGDSVEADSPRYWRREKAIHELGNLTIVTAQLNIAMQNSPFYEKRPQLMEHSNLTLNRRIAEKEHWDEEAIRERGEFLADLACQIWPTPSDFT